MSCQLSYLPCFVCHPLCSVSCLLSHLLSSVCHVLLAVPCLLLEAHLVRGQNLSYRWVSSYPQYQTSFWGFITDMCLLVGECSFYYQPLREGPLDEPNSEDPLQERSLLSVRSWGPDWGSLPTPLHLLLGSGG